MSDRETNFFPHFRIGTGIVIPTEFKPQNPDHTPQFLFSSAIATKAIPRVCRFINRTNESQMLIFTDGACLDNGLSNARAGCAFVIRPSAPGSKISEGVRIRLEARGPTGEQYPQTSNRAELRAVIGALRFSVWEGEGFNSIVIATDSEYVVKGVTSWVRKWIQNDWKTAIGAHVKNKDLWECLPGEVEKLQERHVSVQFWRISRDWNTAADYHAKEAAMQNPAENFVNMIGLPDFLG